MKPSGVAYPVRMGKSLIAREAGALVKDVKKAAKWSIGTAAALTGITTVNWLMGWELLSYGVAPRTAAGLAGILAMPLLHAGWGHLIGNVVAGVPLAFLSMERKRTDFLVVSAVSALTSGLGCWLFGAAGSVHVGASGIVFGLIGFLLGRGWYERKFGTIVMATGVGFFFGGGLLTMLPGLFAGISWQAHLFGFLGGLFVAKVLGGRLKKKG